MTRRNIILLILLVTSSIQAEGQDHTMHIFGKVVDSARQPVNKAFVSIIRRSNQSGISFTTTNENGNFSFQISNKYNIDSLAIKTNAINFQKLVTQPIAVDKENLVQLKPNQIMLSDVVVKGSKPIVQKGDTISYNADAFKRKDDRYLGDIIKNLPGITVDDKGVISYQGKQINNFYIEGDNLLDNRYQIATDNIPSSDISKVQVIEHNQHVKMLNGIVPSDQAAINITLKDRGKFHIINNAEIEGGTPGIWNGAFHNMVFNDRYKAINELKSNNKGIDYSRETGVNGLSGAPDLAKHISLFNRAVMSNLNNMYKFDKFSSLRLNGYYVHDLQKTESKSSISYYLPENDTVRYFEGNNAAMGIDAFNIQLNYNVNNFKTFFDNTLSFNQSRSNPEDAIMANGQNIRQVHSTRNINISNTAVGYSLYRKKHLFNYHSSVQYSNTPQTLTILPGAMPDILNDSIPYSNAHQFQRTSTFYTNNNIAYSHISGHWTFGSNAGINYQNRDFHSDLQLQQTNHSTTELAGFSNSLHWKKGQIYLSPQVTYKTDRNQLHLSAPFNFTHIRYFNDSVADNKDRLDHIFINPSISWQRKIGKENQLSFSYSFGQQAAGASQIFGGKILNNYRNYSSFNRPLLTGSSQAFEIGFNFKRMILAFFANAAVTYSRHRNYFIDASIIQNNFTVTTALPINNASDNISLTCNASKYIYTLNTMVAINSSHSFGRSQQMQNGVLFDVHHKASGYKLHVTPTISNWMDIKFSAAYSINTSTSTTAGFQRQSNSQVNETSSIILYPMQNLAVSFGNQYLQSFHRGQTISSALLMNSYVQHNFTRPAWRKLQLRLSFNNIANVRTYNVVSTSNNMIATYSYLLQPRMLLLSAHFDL
ncbi:TonB-dependent receptor [Chitinophaga rhizosphaerae]|uniref:TonB-dependent receptor n=1 Tax=Chitinophaga rhizosphaerae TaxID=1864947 RepID=UPI000F7FCB76|nr:carboxypeptidase-like regulatory domain-containing protein [Chitinophaga rhizosphaerae]